MRYLGICLALSISLLPRLSGVEVNCETDLQMGQYLCNLLNHIDLKTQQIKGCTKENRAKSETLILENA